MHYLMLLMAIIHYRSLIVNVIEFVQRTLDVRFYLYTPRITISHSGF